MHVQTVHIQLFQHTNSLSSAGYNESESRDVWVKLDSINRHIASPLTSVSARLSMGGCGLLMVLLLLLLLLLVSEALLQRLEVEELREPERVCRVAHSMDSERRRGN